MVKYNLVVISILFVCTWTTCINKLKESRNTLSALSQRYQSDQNINKYIDGFTEFMKEVPTTMEECHAYELATYFNAEFPEKCIGDLGEASKRLIKLNGQTEKKAQYALDLALLEHFYKTKVMKECPAFEDMKPQDIYKKGECAEESYQMSLIIQKFFIDAANFEGDKALGDLDTFLTKLPDALDTCGYSDLANKIRVGMPPECIKSIDAMGRALLELERTYDHLEQAAKTLRHILKAYHQMKYTCPMFGH